VMLTLYDAVLNVDSVPASLYVNTLVTDCKGAFGSSIMLPSPGAFSEYGHPLASFQSEKSPPAGIVLSQYCHVCVSNDRLRCCSIISDAALMVVVNHASCDVSADGTRASSLHCAVVHGKIVGGVNNVSPGMCVLVYARVGPARCQPRIPYCQPLSGCHRQRASIQRT
jgi:hypothetical protein